MIVAGDVFEADVAHDMQDPEARAFFEKEYAKARHLVVAIVGSRTYPMLDKVAAFVETLPDYAAVVSGGARGVDRAGEIAAIARSLHVTSYRPQKTDRGLWVVHKYVNYEDTGMTGGRVFSRFASAAFWRNELIVRDCTKLEAFWDGVSNGTRHVVAKAQEAGRDVHITYPVETE